VSVHESRRGKNSQNLKKDEKKTRRFAKSPAKLPDFL
jgi:hypothetical protein